MLRYLLSLTLAFLVLLAPHFAGAQEKRQKLYITNSAGNDVTIADVATNKVIGRIEVGAKPHGIAAPASQDLLLERYELRGNVGNHYSDEDAIVIATNLPGDVLEFVTNFGLTQPGAEIALKVFVVLTTGNEAGSAAMLVERDLALPLAA